MTMCRAVWQNIGHTTRRKFPEYNTLQLICGLNLSKSMTRTNSPSEKKMYNGSDALLGCFTNLLQLSIYGSRALCWGLCRFFSFLSHTQSVRLLGRGISPSQGRYLHTGQNKHRINAHRYPFVEWDSNPRSQCLSGRNSFFRPHGHSNLHLLQLQISCNGERNG
jgi:hypothetical protein